MRFSARDLALIALSTALIAVCAQITVPIYVVPFTLQTFAVFLSAAVLGTRRATIAVGVYLLMGLCGLPVFSGLKGGPVSLLGPTGGYLIGFLFLSVVTGLLLRRLPDRFLFRYAAMSAGLLVCYAFGTLWFVLVYSRNAESIGWAAALLKCVVPFLLPDAAKIALASAVTVRVRKAAFPKIG